MAEDPIGRAVRNMLNVRMMENGIAASADGLLYDLFGEIAGLIGRVDPAGAVAGARDRRIAALVRQVRALVGPAYQQLLGELQQSLQAAGLQQSAWAAGTLDVALGAAGAQIQIAAGPISPEMLRAIVEHDPFRGATLNEWAARQADTTVFQVRRQVQLGLLQGETVAELIDRVRGQETGFFARDPATGALVARGTEGAEVVPRYTGGVLQTSTRQAEALVRTAVNQVVTKAHFETYAANSDITSQYEYVATLDSRTTFICMSLDGRTWAYDDPAGKQPPQHWNALAAGTMIRSSTGDIPIEDVRAGMKVWTHAGRWRRVYDVMDKTAENGLRELCTSSGRRLLITDEHPVLTLGRGWLRADEIRIGDEVVEYTKESRDVPSCVASEVTQDAVLDAHYRPSHCDEVHVTSGVPFASGGMPATIDFEENTVVHEGKVGDVRPDGILKREGNARLAEGANESTLMASRVTTKMLSMASCGFPTRYRVVHRVVGQHTLPVDLCEPFGRSGLLRAPVVSPLRPFHLRLCQPGGSFSATHLDAMSPAGAVEARPSDPEILLDSSDTFSSAPMALIDKRRNGVPVHKVDHASEPGSWVASTIISNIALPGRMDQVYNLAVEGDETFTADGIIVHNCRSTIVPIVDWKGLGIEPPPESTRASAGGQVKSSVTYGDWLRRQSAAKQDEILGPTRARLFRDGKLSMRDLVTSENRIALISDLPGGEKALAAVRSGS